MPDAPASRLVMVNGGSSTIKLSVYTAGECPELIVKARVDLVGQPRSFLTVSSPDDSVDYTRDIAVRDHRSAAETLVTWLEESGHTPPQGIGHRIVHGGIHLREHQLLTAGVLTELRQSQCLDLAHLPREIALIEVFQARFPETPQVACLDTAFHRDLPRLAQILPIPTEYTEAGVRRLGFHGLSYTYLLHALREVAGEDAANGRLILAHLGSGASMAAVHRTHPVDTTMGFTAAGGMMMGSRPGDLDPGLLIYMMTVEKRSPDEMDEFISRRCGLAGVSGGTSDVRELESRRNKDKKAADALDLFCYVAKKWIGAYYAVLGGLDCLVFSGGIGEHSPQIREGICSGLEVLGLHLDAGRNAESASVISAEESSVTVRVIPTDEEAVMAEIVSRLIATTDRI